MKNVFIIAAMLGVCSNLFAACPKKIDGTWNGTQTNTKTIITNFDDGGSSNSIEVANGIMSMTVSGQTAKISSYSLSESGYLGGITDYPSTDALIAYDRSTCSGVITMPNNETIKIILTNNGKTSNAIGYENNIYKGEGYTIASGTTKSFRFERQ